jgi:uridine kinase
MSDPSPDVLAGLIRAAPARLGRTRLVAVDGPAGSGKTTLAARLADALPGSGTVHMDDVYCGWETDFAEVHERLRAQVIEPLGRGEPGRYQRYDWYAGELADWVDLPVPEVLLLEGVASGARSLDSYLSLLIWVEVPRAQRISRAVERDGPDVLAHWYAWMDHEAGEHRRQDTRARAHMRLGGEAGQAS